MALKTINDLTAKTTPASTDLVAVWDVAGGATKKSTLAQIATYSGAAMLAVQQTFTKRQAITPDSAGGNALTITLPTNNGASYYPIRVEPFDNGTGPGSGFMFGNNNNGSTPASAFMRLLRNSGTSSYVWSDSTMVMRVHTAPPSSGGGVTDTAGTVIGAQTSHADYKQILGEPVDDGAALDNLIAAAAQVKRFVYKDGRLNGEEFSGVVLDGAELNRYGADPDSEHPAGRILNEVNIAGDLMLAMRELDRRLRVLEA